MTRDLLIELLASMAEEGLLAAYDPDHADGPDYYITTGGLVVADILTKLVMAGHTVAMRNEVAS